MTRRNGPTMIGIGAQKCASSWVHAALGVHPQIGVSDPKEVDFFSYYFDRGYEWYETHFVQARSKSVRFEASPSYLHDPRTPARVHAYDPAMKILLMLRDPIDRAYSNHLHEVIKGHIGKVSFAEGLANNPSYVEQGLYATHLNRWLSAFPRDQLLVLLAEEVSADPDAAAQQVYAFAGVDATFTSAVLHERRNESDRPRFPALRQVLRSGGTTLRKLGLEESLATFKKSGPVARMMQANSVDLRAEIPAMDPVSRAQLVEIFAPEITALVKLLGRNTLPWKTMTELAQQ
jgi:hypothetical protein